MSGKLRLGVVGCGEIARYTALLARAVPRLSLTACCDHDADKAQQFGRRFRIPLIYARFEQMLAEAPLDAVYLALPHHLHAPMIRAAAEAGRSVLVEKPLTRTLAEGVELVNWLEDKPVKVGVNYQYRYDASAYRLAQAVRAGELGRVFSIRINVPWRREEGYFRTAAWHGRLDQAGGGTLITQASHFLDLALWALGEQAVEAVGWTANPGFDVEVETLAEAIIQTESGALINLTSTMAAAVEEAVQVEVYGERGQATYTNLPFPRLRVRGVRLSRASPPVVGLHALQRSLSGFVRWVLDDQPYLIPAQEALPALAALEAVYRSARSGRRESVEKVRSGK